MHRRHLPFTLPIFALRCIAGASTLALLACGPSKSESGTQSPGEPNKAVKPEPKPVASRPSRPTGVEALEKVFARLDASAGITSGSYDVAGRMAPDDRGPATMTPVALLGELFGDSKVCALPKKLRNALSKKIDKDKPDEVVPKAVLNGISDIEKSAVTVHRGLGFQHIIHMFAISKDKPTDSFKFDPEASPKLDGAPTVRNLDVGKIKKPQSSALLYELDCSGYLTTSMNVKAGAGVAKVDTKATANLKSEASMTAIRLIAASPVGLTLNPDYYDPGNRFSLLTRFGVLFSLASATVNEEADSYVVAPRHVHIVATSSQSSRKLQGSLDLTAMVQAGAASASGGVSTDSGFSISNGVSYSRFDVLFMPVPSSLKGVVYMQIKEIRSRLKDLAVQATIGIELDQVGNNRVFRPVLPGSVCTAEWQTGTDTKADPALGRITSTMTDFNGDGAEECTFTLALDPKGNDALKEGTLYMHHKPLDLVMHLPKS